MNTIYLYLGAALIIIWGIGHIYPTRNIIAGYGDLSNDNLRILIMEWLAEGLTLIFLGILVFLVTWLAPDSAGSVITIRAAAVMLIVLAFLSQLTGARTAILPMRLCPIVKTTVAILYYIGS